MATVHDNIDMYFMFVIAVDRHIYFMHVDFTTTTILAQHSITRWCYVASQWQSKISGPIYVSAGSAAQSWSLITIWTDACEWTLWADVMNGHCTALDRRNIISSVNYNRTAVWHTVLSVWSQLSGLKEIPRRPCDNNVTQSWLGLYAYKNKIITITTFMKHD